MNIGLSGADGRHGVSQMPPLNLPAQAGLECPPMRGMVVVGGKPRGRGVQSKAYAIGKSRS